DQTAQLGQARRAKNNSPRSPLPPAFAVIILHFCSALNIVVAPYFMNWRTRKAISSAAVSSAKWPPSTMWISALGTSRRYDSGSEGSNDDSYFPQITSRRGCFSRIHASHSG